MEMEELRYPIGRYTKPETITQEERVGFIRQYSELPNEFRKATENLSDEQLDTPYRPDGWTVRQVVHHVPDSHLNAYIRFKLTLTEDNPIIKPYDEKEWAKLSDNTLPIGSSLDLLEAVQFKLVELLNTMKDPDFHRTYIHPEYNQTYSLNDVLALYAWHGHHHLAHITELIKRKGW